MQKLPLLRPLILMILVGSLAGNAWLIYHLQTSPQQAQVRQEIPRESGRRETKPTPDPFLPHTSQRSQARVRATRGGHVDEATDDVFFEGDPAARVFTEEELISGLIDSGYTKEEIDAIMYDPGSLYDPDSLPPPDSKNAKEFLSPKQEGFEDAAAEGLRAEGLSDEQIEAILYNPGSLPQPASESGVGASVSEEGKFEDNLVEEGLRAEGLSDEQIYTTLYEPENLPQPENESGREASTAEGWKFEDELAEGLWTEGLSEEQIDRILRNPQSLSQPK
jgi:hypothetical protein